MIEVVTAPKQNLNPETYNNIRLFIAGGISKCPDWQSNFIKCLKADWSFIRECNPLRLTIFNPRRAKFPETPAEINRQVVWEYDAMSRADIISYWFAGGSVNPIVFYELGKWGLSTNKTIVVGCDPKFTRIKDVEIQIQLARPEIKVMKDFKSFVDMVVFAVSRAQT